MVTDSIYAEDCNRADFCIDFIKDEEDKMSLSKACFKISISERQFNRLLSNGAKIVSAVPTEKITKFKFYNYHSEKYDFRKGTCVGTDYIVEGYEKVFENF